MDAKREPVSEKTNMAWGDRLEEQSKPITPPTRRLRLMELEPKISPNVAWGDAPPP